ncbi:hypothetical protein QQP08_020885 [Theobroma cacao]|nr:hypothetical protein QQP08_020885 [Theobroma cacao]
MSASLPCRAYYSAVSGEPTLWPLCRFPSPVLPLICEEKVHVKGGNLNCQVDFLPIKVIIWHDSCDIAFLEKFRLPFSREPPLPVSSLCREMSASLPCRAYYSAVSGEPTLWPLCRFPSPVLPLICEEKVHVKGGNLNCQVDFLPIKVIIWHDSCDIAFLEKCMIELILE